MKSTVLLTYTVSDNTVMSGYNVHTHKIHFTGKKLSDILSTIKHLSVKSMNSKVRCRNLLLKLKKI